ncbi:hypothetical protein [Actinoplanes friuliensis]|nr:hypothetical protein [Actinoplanes friuliensis]
MAMTAHDLAAALPDIAALRDRCRALAVLDAVLDPGSDLPYYGYDAAWGPGVELASMDNGSGDNWSIVFAKTGALLRGFDHESPMSPAVNDDVWPGVIDTVPAVFAEHLEEPAFQFDGSFAATVCLWRQAGDDRWHAGPISFPEGADPDGARWMFRMLTEPAPAAYLRFAQDYYEREIDAAAVADVYALRPLTDGTVRRLNPEVSLAELAPDLAAIGYPG